jgi:hypothetical protein
LDWGDVLLLLLNAVVSIGSGGGLWAYLTRRDKVRAATDRLLRGLGFKEINSLGMMYISRGWLTQDEYDEFYNYIYAPYKALGGNGVTDRIMAAVTSLPLRGREHYGEVIREAQTRSQTSDNPSEPVGSRTG